MKLFEWTKRLGQQHWSCPDASVTLCDMSMLGNNYSYSLADSDKVPCSTCTEYKIHIETTGEKS